MKTRLQYEESASREDLLGAEETQVNICQSVSSRDSPLFTHDYVNCDIGKGILLQAKSEKQDNGVQCW